MYRYILEILAALSAWIAGRQGWKKLRAWQNGGAPPAWMKELEARRAEERQIALVAHQAIPRLREEQESQGKKLETIMQDLSLIKERLRRQ